MENGNDVNNSVTEVINQVIQKPSGSSDEKAPDCSENGAAKPRPGLAKGKKRKKPKDSTAPRHPLTGYVRYLNDRRETVRAENPNLPFAEITKLLASEWSNLPTDKKQQYLDAAEQDRERYAREFNAYKQTDAYKTFAQAQSEKKMKEAAVKEEAIALQKPPPTVPQPMIPKEEVRIKANSEKDSDFTNFDIPIFTEEFLDHNKTREAELRQLRKSNTDYEQQNAILQKHIENMKTANEKLEVETMQQRNNNAALQQHLDHLRTSLTNGFANIRLPGTKEVATLQTIDSYMAHLHTLLLENNSTSLMQTVRDIVSRIEFNG